MSIYNVKTVDADDVLKHGHTVAGVAALPLALGVTVTRGVLLRAPGASDPTPNTHAVWVGGADVTADSDAITGGVPLLPGFSMELPIDDLGKIYVISTAAAQDVAWIGV